MKKLALILVIAAVLAGGAVTAVSTPCQAQYLEYATPPPDPYAEPWVGPGTPWVYYNGDWFLNGILYLFFGPEYGWCPYYAYPYSYVARPVRFYAPFYGTWYRSHPVFVERFVQTYPYWRSHRQGRHYDETFYEQHHRGQGGWHQGFHGRPAPAAPQVAPKAGPAPGAPPVRHEPSRVAPPAPAPSHVTPPPAARPAPAMPPERHEPGPARMAPPAAPAPGPSHVAPAPAPHPAPAAPAPAAPRAAPPAAPKPAPAAPHEGGPAPAPPGGGHGGEEKH